MTYLAPLLSVPSPLSALPPQIVDDALSAVRHHFGMPIAYVSLFDGDDLLFHRVSMAGVSPQLRQGARRLAAGSICAAVRDGILPQLVPDTTADPRALTVPAVRNLPVGALIAVPLQAPGRAATGMFCCLSPTPMPGLTTRDHAVMAAYGQLVAQAMQDDLAATTQSRTARQRIADVISDRDFQLLLQPIVSLTDNTVTGAEALCRFRPAPYRSPDTWFADARGVGLHRDLERAVIRKTLDLLPHLPHAVDLSINVSPDMMIHGQLAPLIDGPCCDRIILELTDHQNPQIIPALQEQMKILRGMGVRIAMDDLGTAYHSLTAVLQIKPDIVKLDRDIVRGIHLDPVSRALAAGIVHLSTAIGATVIAEGIERKEDADVLRDFGIGYGQGFLLGRPGGLTALQSRVFAA